MQASAALAALMTLCGPARAGDREFDTLVRRLEARCDTGHTRASFFGLADFAVKAIRPAGASDLRLALFEDLRRPLFTQEEDFTELVRDALGPDWRPFVRVRHRRINEWTCMYAGGSPDRWNLVIATMERREATLFRISLNSEGMMRWIAKPCRDTRTWRRD